MLEASQFINQVKLEAFLLTTESELGGYAKHADGYPDVLHSYLSLCGLSIIDKHDLGKLNSVLCIPASVKI
jgi:geranylgeranyl transferase type-1 subunit beta